MPNIHIILKLTGLSRLCHCKAYVYVDLESKSYDITCLYDFDALSLCHSYFCVTLPSQPLYHTHHTCLLSLRPPQVLQSTLQCDILQSEPAILVTWHFLHQSQSVTSRGALTGVVLIQHNGTTHCSSAVGIFHPSRYSELGLWETHVTICWTPCSSSNGKHDVINSHSIMTWRHQHTKSLMTWRHHYTQSLMTLRHHYTL